MVEKVATRDRLLIVGADLLQAARDGDVSTRAITEAAGVQAPTLYHYFGSKQGLLDEVVSHGFRRFLEESRADDALDPLAEVELAWDTHVQFGVSHPAFYAHIYARVEPGYRCGVVAQVEQHLLEALSGAEDRLTTTPARAAKAILAASTGVVITMISELSPEDGVEQTQKPDWGLSVQVRDALLTSLLRR